jgi:putative FmdB family regulatory protein
VPTYEYACSNCDTTHEIKQSMSDATLTVCPDCGQSTLRKLFGNVGVVFKGAGFYRNDSRDSKKSNTGSASSSTPAAATATKTSDSSTSSTPASTSSTPSTSSASSSSSSSSSTSSSTS